MPLRARVEGREIQVWDLTGEQWSELKRDSRMAPGRIRMACCSGHGAAKTSRSGNPFFAHRPQARQAPACRWAGESAAHALCKLLAASGARAAGWRVLLSGDQRLVAAALAILTATETGRGSTRLISAR